MIRNTYLIIPALVVMAAACALPPAAEAAGSGTFAVAAPQGSVLAARAQVRSLSTEVDMLKTRLDVAEDELRFAERKAEDGLMPASEVRPLELEVLQLTTQLRDVMSALADARRLVSLAEPVDIVLKSSSVRQAAEALSRVSGVKITVDAKVPNDVSVTAQAKGVPLGAVIEVIADAAKLTIAPGDAGGLMLRSTGKLVLNGKAVNYQGGNLPWSDDWAASPGGAYSPLGRRWLSLYGGPSYYPPRVSAPPPAKQTSK